MRTNATKYLAKKKNVFFIEAFYDELISFYMERHGNDTIW